MRNIRGKDLNLLIVFLALWRERNVTKAAKSIGLSQPALSRALSRLRSEFSDPLFVRTSRGVTPTDRTLQMANTITNFLESMEELYSLEAKFDPYTAKKVITIATSDYFEVIAASKLIPTLIEKAPNLTLNFRTTHGTIPKEAMEKGEIDLVISGIYERLAEGFYQQKILSDTYQSTVRKDHPLKEMTLESFTKHSHVLVTPKGDLNGVVNEALAKMGKSRHITIGLPHFLSAGWIIAQTDLILTAPSLIIDNLKTFIPIRNFPPPISLPHLELYQVWHARSNQDPTLKWLRRTIRKCCVKE